MTAQNKPHKIIIIMLFNPSSDGFMMQLRGSYGGIALLLLRSLWSGLPSVCCCHIPFSTEQTYATGYMSSVVQLFPLAPVTFQFHFHTNTRAYREHAHTATYTQMSYEHTRTATGTDVTDARALTVVIIAFM